jgi:hypothetical protein
MAMHYRIRQSLMNYVKNSVSNTFLKYQPLSSLVLTIVEELMAFGIYFDAYI